jgi:hypothetical protein
MSMQPGDSPTARATMLTQMPDWLDKLRLESAAFSAFQDNLQDILRTEMVRTALQTSESTRDMAKRFEEGLLRGPEVPSTDLNGLLASDLFQQHRLNTSTRLLMLGLGGFVAGSVVVGASRSAGLTVSVRAQPGEPNGRWGYALASIETNMTFSAGLECAAWFRTVDPDTQFVGAQFSLNDVIGGVARIYLTADSRAPALIGYSVGLGLSIGLLPMGAGLFFGRFNELSERS